MLNLTLTENSQPASAQNPKTVKEDLIGSAPAPLDSTDSTSHIRSWRVKENTIETQLEAHTEEVCIFDELLSMPAARSWNIDPLKKLLLVSNPTHKDKEGYTALMYAARSGDLDCLQTLLPVSDPNQRNKDGHSALDLAANEECQQAIRHHLAALEAQREAQHLERAMAQPTHEASAPSKRVTKAL